MNFRKVVGLGACTFGGYHLAVYLFAPGKNVLKQNHVPIVGDMKLIHAQVFMRHGARTPITETRHIDRVTWDKDTWMQFLPEVEVPFECDVIGLTKAEQQGLSAVEKSYRKNTLQGGCLRGQLTTVGKQQMFELGRQLRQRYVMDRPLVPGIFNTKDVGIQSTNIVRNHHSLSSCLGGMFGVSSFKEPVVIPVHQGKDEWLYPNRHYCVELKQLEQIGLKQFFASKKLRSLKAALAEGFGDVSKAPESFVQLRDDVVARLAHDLPVPEFLMELLPSLETAAVEEMVHWTMGPQASRKEGVLLAAGRMFEQISENIETALTSDDGPKLQMYQVHDTSIMPLLEGLRGCNEAWPPYAADLAVELYLDDHAQHWVRVVYLGQPLPVPGCTGPDCLVPLIAFYDMLMPLKLTQTAWKFHCEEGFASSEIAKSVSQDEGEDKPPGL